MSLSFIRRYYQVPAELGMHVTCLNTCRPIHVDGMPPTARDADFNGDVWGWNGGEWRLWPWHMVADPDIADEWGITHWAPTGLKPPQPPEGEMK